MAQILIRGLEEQDVAELRRAAKDHGRSLEAEARTLLQQNAERLRRQRDAFKELDRLYEARRDRLWSDSTKLIRQMRDER